MKPGSDQSYQLVRLSILADQLMSIEDLRDMVSMDLDQIARRLQAILPEQEIDLNSTAIDGLLYQSMYEDFQMLLRSYNGVEYRFLKHCMRWFELANLKVLIRGKFSGVNESELTNQLVDVGVLADLPLKNLLETDDPFEMLRLLEQTPYAGIVRRARRIFEEEGQAIFSLDSAIDRNFFIELAYRSRFLHEQDQFQLRRVFGALMDRFNLLWLLRYRFSYGLSPARSYYLLTAAGQHLHSADMMKLAKMESMSSVISALPKTIQTLLKDQNDIYRVELLMELYSLSAAQSGLSYSQSQLTRSFSYILLREAENHFLIAIIKGKQLGFDDDLISQAIGG